MRRWFARGSAGLALGLATWAATPSPAQANPTEGEARSILRDADRPYTIVAGEADGAATVTNPANLGFLRGVNGIIDFALMDAERRRRGSGVGVFLGLPLPLRLLSVGLGYQLLLPLQPEGADSDMLPAGPDPQGTDDSFSKVSMAVAVPLGSWVRTFRPRARATAAALDGLSLGLSYSRLISSGNFHAHGTQHVDVALSYWPSRFLALGLVGRAVNLPRTGRTSSGLDSSNAAEDGSLLQSAVIDPELAVRPLGTPALEVAVGARIAPALSGDLRFRTNKVDPRARLIASTGGVRVFAEAEMMRFNPVLPDSLDTRIGARLNVGVELNFAHFGVAVTPLMSAGLRSPFGVDGAAVRMRVSQERYPTTAGRPRVVTKLSLAKYQGDRGMWALIQEMDAIAERRGVLLLETRGLSLGYAQVEEVREAVLRARNAGGKVVVYLHGASLRSYFLASAADRIISHPRASLEILGLHVTTLYFGDLLQRLGAKPEFVRMAEYKAWPEKMHGTTASAPVAAQRHQLSADMWNHLLRMIARERGQDPRVVKEWIDSGPVTPEEAVRRGVVDDLAYIDELDQELEDWLGRRIRIEGPRQPRVHALDYGPPPRIAVLLVEGDLAGGDSFTVPIIGRTVTGDRTLTKEIERLGRDPSVEAVVVRIDSPGGEVAAADAIARSLDLVRREKPVVVSMGNACASGGYYIATAGQYIFADATSYTGSIGVFYPKVDISGTLEKIGVSVDEEQFGRRAGMRSWLHGFDDDERAAAQADVAHTYGQFLERVATARSMTTEQADAVARGRVWAGVRAIDEGLVDDYGGLREAVARARAIAGLRPGEGVVELVPRPTSALENVRALFGVSLPSPFGRTAGGMGAAAPAAMALRSALPPAMLTALRHLPIGLWWSPRPSMMAVDDHALVITD